MFIYFPGDSVAFSTAKKKILFFLREHILLNLAMKQSNTVLKFIPQTVNFNESLSYSEMYMEIRANSAIMLQPKSEAN